MPFEHSWDEAVHPFLGAAVIDIDADGRFEIFVGGGKGAPDALLRWQNGAFKNVISETGLSSMTATHSAVAIDMDNDRDTDLLISRDDGVYLYTNTDGKGSFSKTFIEINSPAESAPFNVSVADIDNDGDGDLYISYFVAFPSFQSATFNDLEHAKLNRMLLNRGDNTFIDITEKSGTAGKANTFCAVFVDLDMDGLQDLVVGQNTWEVEIFHNNGDLTFSPIHTDSGYGFWMGVGVGDIDADGDQDLFFPNVGTSIPTLLTMGDIEDRQRHTHDWLLLRNDSGQGFTNVTAQSGLLDDGFAWGGVFEDVNLDGKLDLFVAQNYIKWPFHNLWKLNNRAYLSTGDHANPYFEDAPALGLENAHFGQSSLIVDFNGDGYQDFLWVNMDGPLRAFTRKPVGDYITVALADNVANLGARVRVLDKNNVPSHTREVIVGQGFLTDQSPELTFAIPESGVKAVEVTWLDGHTKTIKSPTINQTLSIRR